MATRITYSLATSRHTLTIRLRETDRLTCRTVDVQTHTITLLRQPRGRAAALVELVSADGVAAREKVLLPPSPSPSPSLSSSSSSSASTSPSPSPAVVCVDFLPRVFGGAVWPLYVIAADRVAVFMQPFAAGVGWRERPVVRIEGGKFEDVRGAGLEDLPVAIGDEAEGVSRDGRSGVEAFQEALEKLFGPGRMVCWGSEPMLTAHTALELGECC